MVSGGAGVIYKGEGWYVTDYSKKSSGGKEPSASPEKKEGAAKSDVAKPAEESKPSSADTATPALAPKSDD